jgi:hypothetical protein
MQLLGIIVCFQNTHWLQPASIANHMVAPFSAHLAVYKNTQVNKTSRKQHWTGYLLDDTSRAVLWCNGTVTHYGPAAVHDDLDPDLYSDDCLAHDRGAAELIIDAMRLLRANGTAEFKICDGPAKSATAAAITAIKKHYRNPVPIIPSLDWLYWLDGKLSESCAAGVVPVVPKQCRKCGVDGCTGWAPPYFLIFFVQFIPVGFGYSMYFCLFLTPLIIMCPPMPWLRPAAIQSQGVDTAEHFQYSFDEKNGHEAQEGQGALPSTHRYGRREEVKLKSATTETSLSHMSHCTHARAVLSAVNFELNLEHL